MGMREKLRRSCQRLVWSAAGLPQTARRKHLDDAQKARLRQAEAAMERAILQTVARLSGRELTRRERNAA